MNGAIVATLTVGTHLVFDGERWKVVGLAADRATIESRRGDRRSVAITHLLGAEGSRLLVEQPASERGVGAALASLDEDRAVALRDKLDHVREVLTGFRAGDASLAAPGEPRPEYHPRRRKMARYLAKAAELGIHVATVRRWVRAYRQGDVASLIDGRLLRPCDPLRGVDPRWLDALRAEIAENVGRSRCTRTLMLDRAEVRLESTHGKDEVPIPKPTTARAVLAEITRGTNAFTGSAKARRGIAARPPTPYGRFRSTRPGEYVILDTTRLDVFAMEPVTLRWVAAELTVAMDLYSRCIVAVRLTPVSTKAVDAAALMFEVICPDSRGRREGGSLPYAGVPTAVVVDPDKASDNARLPAVFPDTVVADHGKIYLSDHLRSVCSRFGISIQPARPRMPTDKAPLERFFRTLGEDLLAALPGYKGPDVHGRGSKEHVEDEAYYFLDELEQIIREWTAERYHRRVHHGIAESQVPGLEFSPMERYEAGIARAGLLRVPTRPDLAYDFLPVEWRTIQHYGVELNGLRYDGAALNGHRDRKSPYTGVHAGEWPVRYDPDDVSRVFFQDPEDHTWHELRWVHADDVPAPFSGEVLAYARRLAARTHKFPDDRLALRELLERWDAGMASGRTERRMALRLSQQRAERLKTEEAADRDLSQVEAVRTRQTKEAPADQRPPTGGDDDDPEELAAIAEDEGDEGGFYDDAY